MDNSPADIVAQYLIDQGLLITPGDSGEWPVYVGSLPDGNDASNEAVGCMDTTPVKDGRIMRTGENIFHWGGQLLVRAIDYNIGWAKTVALMESLEVVKRVTVTIESVNYRLDNITIASGPVALGQEEGTKRRELFSLNFLVTLKEL